MGHESVMRDTAYELVVPGTFYIIVYEVYKKDVRILSVFHSRQNR